MAAIATVHKRKLSEVLSKVLSQWGRVKIRAPYKDDDDEGGGESGLMMREHPFLSRRPVGAASDLTAITNDNIHSEDAAKENVNECCPELKKQPTLRNELAARFNPKYQPGA